MLVVTDENFSLLSALKVYTIDLSKLQDVPEKIVDNKAEQSSSTPSPESYLLPQNTAPIVDIVNTKGKENRFTVGAWSYDGKYVVAGTNGGHIVKFSVEKADSEMDQYDAAKYTSDDKETSNANKGEISDARLELDKQVHEMAVSDLQMSLDNTYFVTSSRDKTAKLFDTDSFKQFSTYEALAPANSAAITTVKDFVIVGGGQDASAVTTSAAQEGDFKAKFFHKIFEDMLGEVKGHFGPINTLATDPKGRSFASGGEDGYIRLHHFDKAYFDFYYDLELRYKQEQELQA